jgi:hypothetical protein
MDLQRFVALTWTVAVLFSFSGCSTAGKAPDPPQAASSLPDISGLAWLDGDEFLAVHDAKDFDERPRVSRIALPKSTAGPVHQPIDVLWPDPQGPSRDLESIARIPRTSSYLLAESGSAKVGTPRIFLANDRDRRLEIIEVVDWPVPIQNVEGAAVGRVHDQLVFLFAERAEGRSTTPLRWAGLTLRPLAFGPFQEVAFTAPDPSGPYARPVSAIEIDESGQIYVASATDPGNDSGPFRSVIWGIGRIEPEGAEGAKIIVYQRPERLATLDGVKVEGLALRQQAGLAPEIFFGTDDENYGGILRLVPSEADR